jgi:dTDP-glucose 4,6-dehydratase/UDP-glucuronate decarboxylase
MTSIVTGGAGFLGSHLVDALLRRGERVVVVDNLSTGRLSNLDEALLSGRVMFVFADLASPNPEIDAAIESASQGCIDRIFHLASPASPEAYGSNPWGTLAVNSIGTMRLVDLALKHSADFLFASTSEIYGDPLVHPQPETYFGNVDPIGPRSCYDEGKRFGEAVVAAAVRERGLAGRIVRFFNCYGPRMEIGDGRLIPALVDAAMRGELLPVHGDGKQTRSLTYVDDAVAATLLVADSPHTILRPVNIGNDDERSVLEIAAFVSRACGVELQISHLPARPQDPQRRRPDTSRSAELRWYARTPLETGLMQTVEWLRGARISLV